jgi:hypothetical protein
MTMILEELKLSLADRYVTQTRDLKRFGMELVYISKTLLGTQSSWTYPKP